MGTLKIGNKTFITSDKDKLHVKELESDDLRLDRDETLEYKRRVYRRYDPSRSPLYLAWKRVRGNARKKHCDFPLSYRDFADLLLRSPVQDIDDNLTCLSSLVERKDGSVSFHPYKGGIQVKYLGRLVLDTSY